MKLQAYHVLPDSVQMQRDFLYVLASLAVQSRLSNLEDVLAVAKRNGIGTGEVVGFQEFEGKGFGGLVTLPGENHPRAIISGTRAFLAESGLDIPAILEVTARQWEADKSVRILLLGWDGWVRGVLKFGEFGS